MIFTRLLLKTIEKLLFRICQILLFFLIVCNFVKFQLDINSIVQQRFNIFDISNDIKNR